MRKYLIFQLYGAMASWGDIAVGEFRPSFAHPSKSAVLGLVAAALGITREEQAALDEFAEAYGFAVRVDTPGTLLRDYHTIQAPPTLRRGRRYLTRKDELSAPSLSTILSQRDYYCDARYVVCLWIRNTAAPYSLQALSSALESPHFPLYLGRKSCPPALPLCPQVQSAETLKSCFDAARFPGEDFLEGLPRFPIFSVYWDDLPDAGLEGSSIVRRDTPGNRRAWQFSDRSERYAGFSQGEGE